jgi:hypothetical protein
MDDSGCISLENVLDDDIRLSNYSTKEKEEREREGKKSVKDISYDDGIIPRIKPICFVVLL